MCKNGSSCSAAGISDTAFVIVSGYDDFSYCREALRLQITDYSLKPVNYEEFGTCIDNLKIALFRCRTSEQDDPYEERTIYGITRFLQRTLQLTPIILS